MTPVLNPQTRGERLYNESHIRTRNAIERLIGIWKRRFPIIAYGIRLKLETAMAIIPATAVLHNIAREMNEPEPPPPEDIDMNELNYLIETDNVPNIPEPVANNATNYIRTEIINYFANL